MTVTPPKVISFYINLIDEQIDQLGNHLADDILLYWYGRTVKGKDLVLSFLSNEIASPEHNITSAQAIPEIHYREISSVPRVCTTKPKEESCAPVTAACVGLGSRCESLLCEEDFPDRKHNESDLQDTPDLRMSEYQKRALLNKPRKRKFTPHPRLSMLISNGHTNFLEAKGSISYRRIGRYGYGRPWHRECTLQLAYSCPHLGADPVSCCEFSVIIYSDQMKCRRNLTKVFEQMSIDAGDLKD